MAVPRKLLLRLLLPGFLVSLAFGVVNVSLLYRGTTVLEEYSLYFQILILALFLAPALVAAGKVARNHLFGLLAVPALVMCMGMVAGYNAFFTRLLTAPNWIKALFVSIINPVLFEIIVVWCRVLARSHRHNHPLTSVMTVAVAMTLKKLYGRYLPAYTHHRARTLTLTLAPTSPSPWPSQLPSPSPSPLPSPSAFPSHSPSPSLLP